MVLQSCLQVRAQVPLFSLTSRACSDSRRRAENRCVALYKANSHTRQSFHPSWTLPPLHQSLKLLRKKSGLHRQSQGPLPCHQLPQQPNVRCLIGSSVSPQRYAAPIISVVIPVFNEVQSIGVLVERVASVLQRRGYTYEILCVDDGSTDGTTRLLKALAGHRRDLRTIVLRRNFGQTAALSAGLDASVGDVIVTLDADLQNDPDDIPRLVEHLLYGGDIGAELADGRARGSGTVRDDGGYDMVCGWRRERQDDVIRRVPSQVANWLIGRVTGVRLHDCGCSLKAFRADLASALRLYGETHRLIPAIAATEGAAIAELPVRHHPRSFGSSKYPALGRTPRVILDLILVVFLARFRDRPMQLFGFVGGALLLGAAGCAAHGLFYAWAVARHWGLAIAWPSAVPTLVLALELGVAGIQMVFLGLLADICIRIFFESQNRAHYNVREVVSSTSGIQ